jgi:pimeloyl-ACP methyl ester carboxylesterase
MATMDARVRGARSSPATIADEVLDVVAIARAIAEPMIVVGHSSGGVVALEALVALPAAFAGAVIHEAPVVTDLPLGSVEANAALQAASDAGKPGRAIQIFTRDIVRIPASQAWLIRGFLLFARTLRRRMPRQVDDTLAIRDLGDRLEQYAAIEMPVLLLGGEKSPAHLGARLDSLEDTLPTSERVTMKGQGHSANVAAPAEVASTIAEFVARAFNTARS